ncbi:MAG TPA: GNAT family N-acetyltransferase [Terriglobales bacterium]|nr:GNAT family N-acetyltransferase [Terriglobales bacterium]
MKPEEVTLRPVQPADEAFLLQVYACTRAAEMAMVPWSAEQKAAFVRMQFEAQLRHYRAQYPGAEHSIIQHQGRDVGRLYLDRAPEHIHILDVTVLPEHRGAGLGTLLLRRLMEEGARARLPLSIYVESFNPSQRLFARLGFRKQKEEGIHWLLQWMPAD